LNASPLSAPDAGIQVRIYYRGAAAAILVFDMTEKTSFLKLKDWVTELQTVLGNDLLIAVACNKCDLSSRREVSMEQAQDFAASLGATLFETSAKTNQGVEELFLDLSAKLLQRSEGDC
jgi:Ras-related protein Rab-21